METQDMNGVDLKGFWNRWRRRRAARNSGSAHRGAAAPRVLGAGPVSRPETPGGLGGVRNDFLPLPDETPFEMLRAYRFLRDAVPDISDAVWTWKRLCQTERRVEIAEAASARAEEEARRRVAELDERAHGGEGMAVLLDTLYGSLFTFGAAAMELVPGRGRGWIHDVTPVDVWTLRFRRENGRLQAYQVIDGEPIALPMERFVYIPIDRDGTNPYGRSMLRAIPFVVRVQQRLLEDMARAAHNTGWSRLHVRYTPESRMPGETAEAHRARMVSAMTDLRDQISGLAADQNILTGDNVNVSVLQGDQRGQTFYDNHKAVEEQVITGLHMMPVLMGRNYGSTETYGTAQFEIVNRQVETVNRGVGAALERLYNADLALGGVPARVRVTLGGNRTTDVLREAEARSKEIDNTLRLRDAGLLDDTAARAALGLE